VINNQIIKIWRGTLKSDAGSDAGADPGVSKGRGTNKLSAARWLAS